jgi:hypothetical protein
VRQAAGRLVILIPLFVPTLALALAPVLAACGPSYPPTITPALPTGDPSTPTPVPNAAQLQVQVLNSELAAGLERLAFRVRDEAGNTISDGMTEVTFYRVLSQAGQARKTASGAAEYFGRALPDGGSWVVYTDFDSSGTWSMDVTARRPDGSVGQSRVSFEVIGRTQSPRVGLPPPAVDTPVLAAGADPATVTSDPQPDPELYRLTVAEAGRSRKPTVVFIGSPAHCASALCRASLAAVKQVKQSYGSRVNFIHIESRDLADPSQPSAAAQAWGLTTEPWLFVLDAGGRVAGRMEGGVDPTELQLFLDRTLGQSG